MLAGTYVIKERVRARRAPLIEMPPELAGWAGAADIRRLPDDLALHVRRFLQRADRMKDDVAGAGRHCAGGLRREAGRAGAAARDLAGALPGRGAGRAPVPGARSAAPGAEAAQARHAVLHRLPHG